jgi:hypothetical protein
MHSYEFFGNEAWILVSLQLQLLDSVSHFDLQNQTGFLSLDEGRRC